MLLTSEVVKESFTLTMSHADVYVVCQPQELRFVEKLLRLVEN